MAIYCDTSVWDAICKSRIAIKDIQSLPLISTHNSFIDWISTSQFRRQALSKINQQLGPIVHCSIKYSGLYQYEPFYFILEQAYPDLSMDSRLYESTMKRVEAFEDIGNGVLKQSDLDNIRSYSMKLSTQKNRFQVNSQRFIFKMHGYFKNKGKLKSLLPRDVDPIIKELIFGNCQLYARKFTNKPKSTMADFDWSKHDLLIRTMSHFFLSAVKQYGSRGAPRLSGNDNIDFLNLAYIQPGDQYWTLDTKGVIPIIKQIGLEPQYLYQFQQ